MANVLDAFGVVHESSVWSVSDTCATLASSTLTHYRSFLICGISRDQAFYTDAPASCLECIALSPSDVPPEKR